MNKRGGRPAKLSKTRARKLRSQGLSTAEIAGALGCSRRWVQKNAPVLAASPAAMPAREERIAGPAVEPETRPELEGVPAKPTNADYEGPCVVRGGLAYVWPGPGAGVEPSLEVLSARWWGPAQRNEDGTPSSHRWDGAERWLDRLQEAGCLVRDRDKLTLPLNCADGSRHRFICVRGCMTNVDVRRLVKATHWDERHPNAPEVAKRGGYKVGEVILTDDRHVDLGQLFPVGQR